MKDYNPLVLKVSLEDYFEMTGTSKDDYVKSNVEGKACNGYNPAESASNSMIWDAENKKADVIVGVTYETSSKFVGRGPYSDDGHRHHVKCTGIALRKKG